MPVGRRHPAPLDRTPCHRHAIAIVAIAQQRFQDLQLGFAHLQVAGQVVEPRMQFSPRQRRLGVARGTALRHRFGESKLAFVEVRHLSHSGAQSFHTDKSCLHLRQLPTHRLSFGARAVTHLVHLSLLLYQPRAPLGNDVFVHHIPAQLLDQQAGGDRKQRHRGNAQPGTRPARHPQCAGAAGASQENDFHVAIGPEGYSNTAVGCRRAGAWLSFTSASTTR